MRRVSASVQFFKFLLVGLSNFAINAAVYAGLIYLGAHYLLASAVGAVLGVVNSFLWNRYFVFRSGDVRRQLTGTAAVYAAQILISWADLIFLIEYCRLNAYAAYWINVAVVTAVSFVGLKFFAFKQTDKSDGGR